MGTSHILAFYVSVLSNCFMQDKWDCPKESHEYLPYNCILRVRPVPLSYIGQAGLAQGIPWVPPTCLSYRIVLCRTSGSVLQNLMGTFNTLASYVSVLSDGPT